MAQPVHRTTSNAQGSNPSPFHYCLLDSKVLSSLSCSFFKSMGQILLKIFLFLFWLLLSPSSSSLVCECGGRACVWRAEDNLAETVLSFHQGQNWGPKACSASTFSPQVIPPASYQRIQSKHLTVGEYSHGRFICNLIVDKPLRNKQ